MVYNHCPACVEHDFQTSCNRDCKDKVIELERKHTEITFGYGIESQNKKASYQDDPSLFVMKSNNILVLRPNRAPNAIASAPDAI